MAKRKKSSSSSGHISLQSLILIIFAMGLGAALMTVALRWQPLSTPAPPQEPQQQMLRKTLLDDKEVAVNKLAAAVKANEELKQDLRRAQMEKDVLQQKLAKAESAKGASTQPDNEELKQDLAATKKEKDVLQQKLAKAESAKGASTQPLSQPHSHALSQPEAVAALTQIKGLLPRMQACPDAIDKLQAAKTPPLAGYQGYSYVGLSPESQTKSQVVQLWGHSAVTPHVRAVKLTDPVDQFDVSVSEVTLGEWVPSAASVDSVLDPYIA
jgi:hypothetical protein